MAKKTTEEYRKILDLDENADVEDINSAFRKLSLKFHPDKNQDPGAKERFQELSDAREYLLNEKKKKVPNQFESQQEPEPYMPDSEAYLRPEPCTESPPEPRPEAGTYISSTHHSKDPPVILDFEVTFEELFTGCTKTVTIEKLILDVEGKVIKKVSHDAPIPVRRGCPLGTRFTFSCASHRRPYRIPGDVIFILNDAPNQRFRRVKDGNNLCCDLRIPFAEKNSTIIKGIDGKDIRIDGRSVENESVRSFGSLHFGAGLPHPENPEVRGGLTINVVLEQPDKKEDKKADKKEKKRKSKSPRPKSSGDHLGEGSSRDYHRK